jgi:hypothetical protein
MEPYVYDETKNWGVKSWKFWNSLDENIFLQVRSHKNFYNNAFWQLNASWNDLQKNIVKNNNNKISSICSSKYFDFGHIKRIDFLKFLENKNDPDVVVDIYNHDNIHNFKNCKSLHPKNNKDFGIMPYKYYFMFENNQEYNYLTEKIWEPILTESLCFYWGCPNITDYIHKDAFVLLDVNDFEKSFNIIKNAINNNLWEKRLSVIQQEKQKILNYYSFCPTVQRIINDDLEYKKYFGNKYKNIKNVCFIHSFTKNNNTNILEKLLKSIFDSGLFNFLDLIIINNIGEMIDINKFNHSKIKIINFSDNGSLFEIPTINLLHTFSNFHSNANILYLHTKGNGYDILTKNIEDWIDLMLHFVVNKYNDCIEFLKDFDTVGCNFTETPFKHYSGNFWWAKSNYINRLSKIPLNYLKHDAEFWLLKANNVKFKNIFNSGINHYENIYPNYNYN